MLRPMQTLPALPAAALTLGALGVLAVLSGAGALLLSVHAQTQDPTLLIVWSASLRASAPALVLLGAVSLLFAGTLVLASAVRGRAGDTAGRVLLGLFGCSLAGLVAVIGWNLGPA